MASFLALTLYSCATPKKLGYLLDLQYGQEEPAAAAPELPFYFYHIPAFNGCFLPMLDFLKAVDGRIPNFAGIKYTFESLYEYNQCRLYKDGKFDMLHGQDETYLPSLAQGGAQGGICGTTNYNGREQVAIGEAWAAGDLERARELQNFSQEVINVICHFRGNIVGGKRIMKLIGLDLGPNRIPWRNMTDEEEAAMKRELEEIHFFERCNRF
jgi:N-acetylneuraminate lyase